jgi:Ca2+-binding RTX toxin-like protein
VQVDIEKILGGSGDDDIRANDVYTGGAVFGGPGNDTLRGDTGPDALWGEDGDDLLVESQGADYLRGGSGNDTYVVQANFDDLDGRDISLDGVANDGTIGGARQDNVYSDIENVIGGPGNDRLTGSSANNRLEGGDGDDTILGLTGDDTLLGGAGSDTLTDTQGTNSLDGGPGNDTINGVPDFGGAEVASSSAAGATAGLRRRGTHRGIFGADGAAAISESL